MWILQGQINWIQCFPNLPPGGLMKNADSPAPTPAPRTLSLQAQVLELTFVKQIPQEILISKVCKIWSNNRNLSPLFSYENFQAYRKIQRNLSEYQRIHYLDSTTDVYYTCFITYLSIYPLPSPSSHPSLSWRFSRKLQASVSTLSPKYYSMHIIN